MLCSSARGMAMWRCVHGECSYEVQLTLRHHRPCSTAGPEAYGTMWRLVERNSALIIAAALKHIKVGQMQGQG